MVTCFYVEVVTDEDNINAPSSDDIVELVRGELVGPAPEDYGITRVRVGNTEWTAAAGTVKAKGGLMAGQLLVHAAKAVLRIAVPLEDVVGRALKAADRERWHDALVALRRAVDDAEVR